MEKTETKKVTFDCPVEYLERLERLAEKGDLPRSRLVANIVMAAVDTLEDCEKIGLLQTSLLIRDMAEKMKDWARIMRERTDLKGLTNSK